jgi:hypothetical protein
MLMRVVSLGFAMLASGRDVTGSGSCIYDNGYYLIIKSYSSVVVVKFATGAEFHWSFCRTILKIFVGDPLVIDRHNVAMDFFK